MSLIIHELSTDQEEQYGQEKTIRILAKERMHMLTMAVTIELAKDLPAFLQILDAFIAKHTTLLPDYRGIKFPCGSMLSIMVSTGDAVTIWFHEVESNKKATTVGYPIPTEQMLEMPDPERHRGWLENSN